MLHAQSAITDDSVNTILAELVSHEEIVDKDFESSDISDHLMSHSFFSSKLNEDEFEDNLSSCETLERKEIKKG